MEKMRLGLKLSIGNPVVVQYPAHIPEGKWTESNTYIIPEITIKLQKVIKLDNYFAYFDDGSKIERYRISKIIIDKESFESEEFAPLRIANEDNENLNIGG